MRWFRDHIRQGSWLALVALAVNFAMAFGHIHASDVTDSGRAGLLVAAIAAEYGDRSHNHPTDNRSDDLSALPKLKLYVREAPTAVLLDKLAGGELDILLVAIPSRGPPIS